MRRGGDASWTSINDSEMVIPFVILMQIKKIGTLFICTGAAILSCMSYAGVGGVFNKYYSVLRVSFKNLNEYSLFK